MQFHVSLESKLAVALALLKNYLPRCVDCTAVATGYSDMSKWMPGSEPTFFYCEEHRHSGCVDINKADLIRELLKFGELG